MQQFRLVYMLQLAEHRRFQLVAAVIVLVAVLQSRVSSRLAAANTAAALAGNNLNGRVRRFLQMAGDTRARPHDHSCVTCSGVRLEVVVL